MTSPSRTDVYVCVGAGLLTCALGFYLLWHGYHDFEAGWARVRLYGARYVTARRGGPYADVFQTQLWTHLIGGGVALIGGLTLTLAARWLRIPKSPIPPEKVQRAVDFQIRHIRAKTRFLLPLILVMIALMIFFSLSGRA